MLNKEKHQLIMGRILRDVYGDVSIAPLLGFKGGTCAHFFYGLPRFSVDLDFDLLKPENETDQKLILDTVKKILEQYGEVKDSRVKRYTIFFLLSYGDADHNIKFEVNIRSLLPDIKLYYELKEYLGISMLAARIDYLFVGKLFALTNRNETAMRDVYDIWYFAKKNENLNTEVLEILVGKKAKSYLSDCIMLIEQIKDSEILHGLGELVSGKDKTWVKASLRKEAVFLLKNYQSVLK